MTNKYREFKNSNNQSANNGYLKKALLMNSRSSCLRILGGLSKASKIHCIS